MFVLNPRGFIVVFSICNPTYQFVKISKQPLVLSCLPLRVLSCFCDSLSDKEKSYLYTWLQWMKDASWSSSVWRLLWWSSLTYFFDHVSDEKTDGNNVFFFFSSKDFREKSFTYSRTSGGWITSSLVILCYVFRAKKTSAIIYNKL